MPLSSGYGFVRPDIIDRAPYHTAENRHCGETAYLDANESSSPIWAEESLRQNRYPGSPSDEIMMKLAGFYGVEPAQVFFTRGADEGIASLVALCCHAAHGGVVVSTPTFVMYERAARNQGARLWSIPLTQPDWQLDMPGIASAVDEGAKALFLCHPANPLGVPLDRDAIEATIKLCQGRALVVVDEAYIEFASQLSMVPLLSQYDNLVILRTLSKAFGLAGLRVGAVLAQPGVLAQLRKVVPPYHLPQPCLTALATLAEVSWQGVTSHVNTILALRPLYAQMLGELPWLELVAPSATNFLLFRLVGVSPAALARFLSRHGIRIRTYENLTEVGPALRVTIGTRAELMRLCTACRQYEKSEEFQESREELQ